MKTCAYLIVFNVFYVTLAFSESFVESAYKETARLLNEIYRLPFILELSNGILAKERWEYYCAQDMIYLYHFNNALLTLAAKAPTKDLTEFLIQQATTYIGHEQDISGQKQCPVCKPLATLCMIAFANG
jgi:thiaminase